jgi:hypothetical protein
MALKRLPTTRCDILSLPRSNRIAAHWLAAKIEAGLGIWFTATLDMANRKPHSRMTVFQLL